jgi:pimeloyl-ACP methyl ester carboxylesterase
LPLAALAFVLLSWFFAYKLTAPRQRPVGPPPADFPFAIEPVLFATADEQHIHGWFVPATSADSAVVLLHGYGGDRRQMLPRARFLGALGIATLLYDARACGESTGDVITFGMQESHDLVAAVNLLKARGFRNIGCLGMSQGGATILLAAEKLPELRCVVCESAYDEIAHAMDNRFRHYLKMPGWLGGSLLVPFAEGRTGVNVDDIRPIDGIGKLKCPILLVSGADDPKTLPADTTRLFEAAHEPKELWMVPGVGHRDLFSQEGYRERIGAFLRKHLQP